MLHLKKIQSYKDHFITPLCSLSPSLEGVWLQLLFLMSPWCGSEEHCSGWRCLTARIGMQGHCNVFTTGRYPQRYSNYPLISQHSGSWIPEGLLLHPPLPVYFISKAIKHIFILPHSIYWGSSAMQVKRLQCLRGNQLMPFISLHLPQ